jgi:hypothetical protein
VLGRSRAINAGSGARRSCEGERLLESVRNSEFSGNLIDSEFSGLIENLWTRFAFTNIQNHLNEI